MPVYLHPANLILNKEAVTGHYQGGIEAFRHDYLHERLPENQEDDELFSLAAWNEDEFDTFKLFQHGIHYDPTNRTSADFVIYVRYTGFLWHVDWLSGNSTFAWHKSCHPSLVRKAIYISEETTLDQIDAAFHKGENLFRTIRGF